NDTIDGGQGSDTLNGDEGNDIINGDGGNDIINGGSGDDTLNGGNGNDIINGGSGNDTIDGGNGNDIINGGSGNDTITGGQGDDTICGGEGDDTITNGSTSNGDFDALFGGAGNDTILIQGGQGDAYVDGGDGNDIIDLGGYQSSGSTVVNISSGSGADTITGFQLGTDQFYIGNIDPNTITVTEVGNSVDDVFEITVPGVGTFTVTDNYHVDSTIADVYASFLTSADYTPPTDPCCFTAGTNVTTISGERAVETLEVGDLVMTQDHGAQEIRWIGIRTMPATRDLAPIVITKGTLGNARDLTVSPSHRMLISGMRVQMLFNAPEMLVAAKDLIDGDRVYRKSGGMVTYVHLAFDQHEIIFAEGAPTESLQPFAEDAEAFGKDAYTELLTIFPELNTANQGFSVARPVLTPYEAALLI
ncbi:MAG: Hint domain-containing protein, partial [Rhodobacteraceae bacterium]|nr:Hint domain-containing protein [Paracoccaceae bacterium]